MKFDCQNWQISICSGNPLNISFNLFDMKYFQRKLMISGKSTNTSFHLFDWMYFQRKLMISGNSSNQTTFHLFDWDWDLFPLKQWKELFFQDKYLYCSHFLKKGSVSKISFQIHQPSKFPLVSAADEKLKFCSPDPGNPQVQLFLNAETRN